ncbi:hypothetical protein [Spiroplasma endosymbiont of Megaselia nigra]|uniref:hypothetical protein n=1 Tax=Spiroplasma endosymbiont of Megaselia nigra TaxID=2478537 RepID=UPI000F8986A8|nr:hypothetical protein [Spiroplasma endosymbiont of Megaselia nigra]RUO85919.1 hypothetical protein D9R21_06040 [Spiroplasma endosymbiont of Megaselia nigra]
MGELEKILLMINRWGYLNLEQIALLLKKNIKTIQLQKEKLVNLKMLNVDTLPKKNYYTLTSKAQSHLGREHKKSIKVNYYELQHQDMLIKWLCSQTDIEHYQTERELKMENGNLNAYPDLIITKNDDSEIYVEFERTRKSPDRFRTKLINLREWLVAGGKIHWITPTQTLATWIKNQTNIIGAYSPQNTYEIWNKEK